MRTLFHLRTVLVLLALAGLGFVWQAKSILQPRPIDPVAPVTIKSNGTAWQGQKLVGHTLREGNRLTLRLLLSDRGELTPRSPNFTVYFPPPLETSSVHARFTSIQETRSMQAAPLSTRTLAVSVPYALPESYTYLDLDYPAKHIRLPITQFMLSYLLGMSSWQWFLTALLVLAVTYLYMRTKTRSVRPEIRGIREEPPQDLNVLEMAVMLHSTFSANDLAAFLYDIAQRGFLQIIHTPRGTVFLHDNKKNPPELYEQILIDIVSPPPTDGRLISIQQRLHDMNQQLFSKSVSLAYISVYETLTKRGYFAVDPRISHLYYKTVGIIVQVLSLLQAVIAYFWLQTYLPGSVWLGLAGYFGGQAVYQFGYRVKRYTPAGFALYQEILAFKQFLSSPDPILFSPQHDLFYRYLPYALILDCEEEWLHRFRHMRMYVPQWFTTMYDILDPVEFVQEVHEVSCSISEVLVSLKDPNVD
jgi:hypothetical protein